MDTINYDEIHILGLVIKCWRQASKKTSPKPYSSGGRLGCPKSSHRSWCGPDPADSDEDEGA